MDHFKEVDIVNPLIRFIQRDCYDDYEHIARYEMIYSKSCAIDEQIKRIVVLSMNNNCVERTRLWEEKPNSIVNSLVMNVIIKCYYMCVKYMFVKNKTTNSQREYQ